MTSGVLGLSMKLNSSALRVVSSIDGITVGGLLKRNLASGFRLAVLGRCWVSRIIFVFRVSTTVFYYYGVALYLV